MDVHKILSVTTQKKFNWKIAVNQGNIQTYPYEFSQHSKLNNIKLKNRYIFYKSKEEN